MNIEEEIHKLQEKIECKLNQLRNLHRENECYYEYIRNKKLDDEYLKWRNQFYQQRKWKNKIITGTEKDDNNNKTD